jgi:NADPH:quinone reductase-like Zn-dependent oxidoreductase
VTTASLHNIDLLKSLGATHVIDRKADVVSEARKILQTAPSVVYDAISEDDTQQQGWKVLRSNGQLILVLPASSSINLGEDGKKVAVFFGNVHAQRDIGRSLYAKLTSLLESGKIKASTVFCVFEEYR